MTDDPLLTVILFSAAAAMTAPLGVVPQAAAQSLRLPLFGWANALAAGLMLGVAYTLLVEGLGIDLLAGGVAALLGMGFVRATHAVTGTSETISGELVRGDRYDLDAACDAATHAAPGHRIFLAHTLHAAHEGIAIGAAMALALPLGTAMAVTLAVHNVPEAMVLTRVLTARGAGIPRSALLALASNSNQVLLGAATFVLIAAVPPLLPWVTGFAVGAFVYLVLVELLPDSYHQAGHTSIALVTLAAMGIVVLLTGLA